MDGNRYKNNNEQQCLSITKKVNNYKIYSTMNDDIYIGSTTQKLCERMREHRTDCKRRVHLPLYKAMVEYGKEYFYIELLEKHPCSDKDELRKK